MEMQILNAIQTIRCPFLDALMPLISNCLILWFLFPAILILRRDTRRTGWIIFAALGMGILLCNIVMKNVFQRVRPCDVNTAITLLVKRPSDYSFPSGHTALSFSAVTGLWLSGQLKRWRIPALAFASLIAFSRLYLYLHYPTDILMGVVIGVLCGWMANKMFQMFMDKRNPQKVIA